MDKQCKFCNQPCKPRKDRPGKFFTFCADHQREYQNRKQKEFYQRNREDRIQYARNYRKANPDAAKEAYQRWIAKPENRQRKLTYMEHYLRPWRKYLKDACEQCGFVAEDRRQLDVHHIDGDKQNNNLSNLQTLCPPCHRLIPLT